MSSTAGTTRTSCLDAFNWGARSAGCCQEQASEPAGLRLPHGAGPAKGREWDDGKSHDAAENCERAETRRRNEESGADAATRGGQRNYEVDGALSTSAKGERHRFGDHRAAADQSEVPPETQQDERQTKNDHRGRSRVVRRGRRATPTVVRARTWQRCVRR